MTDDSLSTNQLKMCRICLDTDHPSKLISPCLCSGGSEYVHRKCLDDWRALNKGGQSFDYCEVCQFKFIIEPVFDNPSADRKRLWLFYFLVTRDITLILLLIQGIIIGMTFSIRNLDRHNHVIPGLFHHSTTEIGAYYLSALIIFFILIGLFVFAIACCSSGGELNCGGGGDGGAIIAVLMLFFAVIGLIIGIILSIVMVREITKSHMEKLWLRQEAKKYVVKDFQGRRNELPTNNILRQHSQQLAATNLMTSNTKNKTSSVPIHASASTPLIVK